LHLYSSYFFTFFSLPLIPLKNYKNSNNEIHCWQQS
jgi:hypothetical protein